MSASPVTVDISVRGLGQWQAASARSRAATLTLVRPLKRILYSPGDHHVDSIARDSLDRRLSPEVTALRLLVAADLADVLDGGAW